MSEEVSRTASEKNGDRSRCPVDHAALSQRKTTRSFEPAGRPVERDPEGVWHVRGFSQARAVLRSADTKQAGFNAEALEKLPQRMRPPILYQEGQPHHEQRRQTARFFSPKTVSENYRGLMEELAEAAIRKLRRERRADLDALSMDLAVGVAGRVVGLTESRVPGMARRLDAFFEGDVTGFGWSPRALLGFARNQARVAAFFYLDVKPAIEARKKEPREDVISHLLSRGYGDAEILTECITYGAAGMATTREFISIAAWHMLEQPALRERYLRGDEGERHDVLGEILRLEPVVGRLYRRATADLRLEDGGETITIPRGGLIALDTYAVNADEAAVGECPLALVPGRKLRAERVGPAVMSFGDGHHRCPGFYVALRESDVFLTRLLSLEGLRIDRKPSVSWNELIAGYELRGFTVALA
ncbi:cytochrome P450 [Rubrobacter marinus]|uniref:Cytochrome P450 n=1 Tax=Rubrobacter marinus TaxID=2653852 RepID=A0A6G8PZT1_9ACTN|nr:cytochrome P450 [Rubrobacter marinus]QIN79678.1 cytochrome P450 [Rubrobacter marinus]